jgi:hypothetical protein
VMLNLHKIYNDHGQEQPDHFDSEYGAALYILTSTLGIWNKAMYAVYPLHIEFATMLKKNDWSGGTVVLIELAGNLFNNGTKANPNDLKRLDDMNIEVALNAFLLRFFPYYRSDFEYVLPLLDTTEDAS